MEHLFTTYVFPILTIFGFLILYFLLKNLLPSYFSEKGKNLATHEDISGITKLVEEVKQSFTIQNEKLKANLSVLTNVHTGLVAEERNAIVDYNEKYFQWLNFLTDSYIGNIDDTDNTELDKYKRSLHECYLKFLNSETRFKLFIRNSKLIELANKMKMATLENLAKHMPNYIISLKHNNIMVDLMKTSTPDHEQSTKYKDLNQQKANLYSKFSRDMLAGFKNVADLNSEFQTLCRDHVYELLQQQEKSLV